MTGWIRSMLALAAVSIATSTCTPQFALADDSIAVDSAKLFSQLDTNGDEAVAEDEVPKDKQPLLKRLLRTADKNGDGRLSRDEFVAGLKGADKPKPTDESSPADKATPDKAPPKDEGNRQGIAALVERMDKNGDGRVTPDEVPEERRDRFKSMLGRFDKNKDGALSKEEVASARPDKKESTSSSAETPAGGRDLNQARQRMKEADKNGDGKLSKEEMPERMAPLFGVLDKDKDGLVDSSELRAGLEQMRERAALDEKQQQLNEQQKKLNTKKAVNRRQAKVQAAKKRANKQEAQRVKEAKQNAKRDKNDGTKKNDADGKPA